MSQGELAEAAGIALSVVQAIEQGRSDPKLRTVLALLDVLKAQGVELLVETDRVACGVYVVVGSNADRAASIRPAVAGREPPPKPEASGATPSRGARK